MPHLKHLDPRCAQLCAAGVLFFDFWLLLEVANENPQRAIDLLQEWFSLGNLFLLHGDVREAHQEHPQFACLISICGSAKLLFECSVSWDDMLDEISRYRLLPGKPENMVNPYAEPQPELILCKQSKRTFEREESARKLNKDPVLLGKLVDALVENPFYKKGELAKVLGVSTDILGTVLSLHSDDPDQKYNKFAWQKGLLNKLDARRTFLLGESSVADA